MIDAQHQMLLHVQRHTESAVMSMRCKIMRPSSQKSFDPATGINSVVSEEIADTECLIRPAERDMRQIDSGGQSLTLNFYNVRLPQNTPLQRGDVIVVTESQDSCFIGKELVVREVKHDEWQVVRRALAEEVI